MDIIHIGDEEMIPYPTGLKIIGGVPSFTWMPPNYMV